MRASSVLLVVVVSLPAALGFATRSDVGDDLQITDEHDSLGPARAALAYNAAGSRYLIGWDFLWDMGAYAMLHTAPEVAPAGPLVGVGVFESDAFGVALAYNAVNDEFLMVCSMQDPGAGEYEIVSQRLDGTTGAYAGPYFHPLSDVAAYGALSPKVAYNAADNEYLVVWVSDEVPEHYHVYAQRLDGATGARFGATLQIGDREVRLASWLDDPLGVAYSSASNEYLVVWAADIDSGLATEFEIVGQRLDATGAEVGADDFRLSDLGPDGSAGFEPVEVSVAFNAADAEYLVVWSGDDDAGSLADDEHEVFGQRVDAITGAELGANDFRISQMGPDGDPTFDAASPDVIYNASDGEYLVVWSGNDGAGAMADGEREIFGQRLDAAGGPLGVNEFRISEMGPDGSSTSWAADPAVVFDSVDGEYLVAWNGVDGPFGYENVFAQRLFFCPAESSSSETVRLGSPPNPNALLPGVTSGPVLGEIWDPVIDHTSFLPTALVDFLGVSSVAIHAATSYGTLLCNPAPPAFAVTTAPGVAFALEVPPGCSLVGASLCAQGGSITQGGAALALTNALDITIGTF